MTIYTCANCKNYLSGLSCLAFDLIPEDILNGENNHLEPLYDQDNDIVFERANF